MTTIFDANGADERISDPRERASLYAGMMTQIPDPRFPDGGFCSGVSGNDGFCIEFFNKYILILFY